MLLGTTGLLLLGQVSKWTTGQPHVAGSDTGAPNVNLIGKSLYTTYLFPFEATSALLIIAVVGAVVLARRPPRGVDRMARPAPAPGAEASRTRPGVRTTSLVDAVAMPPAGEAERGSRRSAGAADAEVDA